MKTVIILFLLFQCLFIDNSKDEQQYEIKYELTRSNGMFQFNAEGILAFTEKEPEIRQFKLSQYVNLLEVGSKVYNNEYQDSVKVFGTTQCKDDFVYYFDLEKDSILSILHDGSCKSKVLIKDKIFHPDWKIDSEIKDIQGYKAQKATAFVNDRMWEVYFTTDLNINAAPWKLTGLPGVVLEAKAEAKESSFKYEFVLNSIKKIPYKNIISRPKSANGSTFKDFVYKSIEQEKNAMLFALTKDGAINLDKNDFPLYETLEFVEQRKKK